MEEHKVCLLSLHPQQEENFINVCQSVSITIRASPFSLYNLRAHILHVNTYDSYIVDSVLPLPADTDTGDCVLSRGMSLTILPIPLHKIVLSCERVQGEVAVGVRPALPIEEVHFILGNGLAGSCVWANTASPPVVSLCSPAPMLSCCPVDAGPDECPGVIPEVLSATQWVRLTRSLMGLVTMLCRMFHLCQIFRLSDLSDFPLSLFHSELLQEQQSDSSLKEMFERVLSSTTVSSAATGYFVQNGLLFRKWLGVGTDCVGNAVFQLVVPAKFHPLVLKVAHDEGGHFGVRKSYLHILKYFFWPRVKRDVVEYIKKCHVCQLTGKPNQHIKPAPLLLSASCSSISPWTVWGLYHVLSLVVSTSSPLCVRAPGILLHIL